MISNKARLLEKMLKCCDDAVKYSQGLSYEEFTQNELYLTFSVFALSQLGELASRASEELREQLPDIPWQALRGIRNRIVHDYEGVKFSILWDVLTVNIPTLRKQISHSLQEV